MARKTLLGTIGPLIAVALVVGPLPYVEDYSGAAESDDPFGDAAAAESDENPFGTAPAPSVEPKAARAPAKKARPAPTRGLRYGSEAILKAMEEPTSMEFLETPLADLPLMIQEKHKIHVRLDQHALNDVGIPADTVITFAMADIPLRSALELLLRDLDLTWTITSGVLLITTEEAAEMSLTTKVYDVADLLVSTSDFTYRGDRLPTTPRGTGWGFMDAPVGGPMQWGGGTGGAASGTPGGGMFNLQVGQAPGSAGMGPSKSDIYAMGGDYEPYYSRDPMDELIHLIDTVIAPDTWDSVGGPGCMEGHGRLLAISQTIPVHFEIESLLEALRKQRQGVPTVLVDARWLLVDSELLARLVPAQRSRRAGSSQIAVDPEMLERMTRELPGRCAQITCISGRKVYLASGERRTVVHEAIPVVGSGVGYQPVIKIPNVGLLLELCPTVLPGTDRAMLDVTSTVTRWRKPDQPLHVGTYFPPTAIQYPESPETTNQPSGTATVNVDRVRMPSQEFAASLRVPLGKPVLVGGVTFSPSEEPTGEDAQERKQLVLIVRTALAGDGR